MLASPASAGLAWSLIEQRLITWGFSESSRYDARLILFELVANAVTASTITGHITIHCKREEHGIVLGVADSSPVLPRHPAPVTELHPDDLDLSEANFDNNGGRGLVIVTSLAAACGVTPLPSGEKIVWARLLGPAL
ncbi:hypothetical protein DPM19_07245 [Actinomadura craniellae]|uniref:Histidine kinase/HSP90-like ATPase domain-containing protein n=2 Tax=Actinomadura craniellae TaxID=2231787 RepID=A0A365H927_9ACTN|nr:hypothetical protein DPM19_07245 [Actinomadura craniellae]